MYFFVIKASTEDTDATEICHATIFAIVLLSSLPPPKKDYSFSIAREKGSFQKLWSCFIQMHLASD